MGYNDDLKINRTIRKIMIDKDIGVSQIADKTGRSKQSVSTQLKNQSNLTVATIDAMADALGCKLHIAFIDQGTNTQYDCD